LLTVAFFFLGMMLRLSKDLEQDGENRTLPDVPGRFIVKPDSQEDAVRVASK
jgi:hypothetical protein